MLVKHLDDCPRKEVSNASAKNAFMKVLVSEKEGWEDYVMRVVEVEKDGYTPKHQHPWPHINYVIEGDGHLMMNGKNHTLKSGTYAYVPDNTLHQYRNTGNGILKFICIVPKRGHQ